MHIQNENNERTENAVALSANYPKEVKSELKDQRDTKLFMMLT